MPLLVSSRLQSLIAVVIPVLLCGGWSAAADPLLPIARWTVKPDLSIEDKEATNVSGAACAVVRGERKSCLLIGDEVKYARFFSISGETLTPGPKIFLLPKQDASGKKFKETDAEGIAFDNGHYYIIGSHGLNKDGEKQLSRYFSYRIRIDPHTGGVKDFGSSPKESSAVQRSNKLDEIIAANAVLGSHISAPPEEHGVNIEGIAVADGDMFIGFRGPVLDDQATVLQVPVAVVFDNAAVTVRRHPLKLGAGQGVRDLAAVDGGLLVLSGPEDRKPGKAGVFFWKPGTDPVLAADLGGPRGDGAQPEVLLVLSSQPSFHEVVVMVDGAVNGDPLLYRIPRTQ